MKKKSLLILLYGVLILNSINEVNAMKSNSISSFIQQDKSLAKAYIYVRGEWIQGYVTIERGLITRCQFPDIGNGTIATIYSPTRPNTLNPNNPIAVNNNFTHYIDIANYGRAYFSF
jgi:hypothetical protein